MIMINILMQFERKQVAIGLLLLIRQGQLYDRLLCDMILSQMQRSSHKL